MKKILAILAILMLLMGTACAEGGLPERVQTNGQMIIGTEGMWSPWTYHDLNTNELTGYDVEVGKKICEKLGIKAEFMETVWDDLLAALDSRRIDTMINGVEVTPERAEKYVFSIPYCYSHTVLVVRGDNTSITSFDDLKGKNTANSVGSTYMTVAESFGAYADGVDTLEETMEMVLSGRADATLNADVSVIDYLTAHPNANVKVVAQLTDASPVAIPFRKGDEALAEAVSAAIEELRAEGVLSELSLRFFGMDITEE